MAKINDSSCFLALMSVDPTNNRIFWITQNEQGMTQENPLQVEEGDTYFAMMFCKEDPPHRMEKWRVNLSKNPELGQFKEMLLLQLPGFDTIKHEITIGFMNPDSPSDYKLDQMKVKVDNIGQHILHLGNFPLRKGLVRVSIIANLSVVCRTSEGSHPIYGFVDGQNLYYWLRVQ